MNQKKAPTTVAFYVCNYFDELINKLDIYTEESIEEFNKYEKKYFGAKNEVNTNKCDRTKNEDDEEDHYYTKYEVKYSYEKAETLRNEILAILHAHPTKIEYFNGIRAKSIKRIKQLRNEIIEK
jgi:proteasome lid subunit RPN8/RPN11